MSEIDISLDGEKATLKPSVNIVASTVPQIRTELNELMTKGIKEIVIDLHKVHMVDSTGIGLFIFTFNTLQKEGGKIAAINASKDILHLFRAMRLDHHFSISGS